MYNSVAKLQEKTLHNPDPPRLLHVSATYLEILRDWAKNRKIWKCSVRISSLPQVLVSLRQFAIVLSSTGQEKNSYNVFPFYLNCVANAVSKSGS